MNRKTFFTLLGAFSAILFTAYWMLRGTGFFPAVEWWSVALLALVLVLASGHRIIFRFVVLPVVFLYAFYTPTGLTFGAPSYQYIASAVATDLQETKEFLQQIPMLHYLAAFGILAGLFIFRRLSLGLPFLAKNSLILTACGLISFCFIPASKFLFEGGASIVAVWNELTRLNSMAIESRWGKSELSEQSGYDDYVLVIGESARRDYHHAYGYPIENTPFMSSANGVLIDGLKAGGTNTIASLKLMLTKPDTEKWQGDYGLTLVDLVKSAGVKTHWISNHGYLGSFDTPISSIANKSDEKIFLKAGDNDFKEDVSDFYLLPKFEAVLTRPEQGKRFIVLHLYGSHPIACDRVKDYPLVLGNNGVEKKFEDIHCYVSSIKKTDQILAEVYHKLQQHRQKTGRRFSMIYFADHGLAHQISHDYVAIHNSSGKSKLHFDVPLFKISSDDTERKVLKVFKSGLNFTDGIGHWLGIRNPQLNTAIDLFSPEPDVTDYGLQKIIDGFDVEPDPAIVLEPLK